MGEERGDLKNKPCALDTERERERGGEGERDYCTSAECLSFVLPLTLSLSQVLCAPIPLSRLWNFPLATLAATTRPPTASSLPFPAMARRLRYVCERGSGEREKGAERDKDRRKEKGDEFFSVVCSS
jgi:hypothetical protein